MTIKRTLLKPQVIKKINTKSARQAMLRTSKTGQALLRSEKRAIQSTKEFARLTQKSTSIVLTQFGITNKAKRARIQWAVQQAYRDEATSAQVEKSKRMLSKEFGSDTRVASFMNAVVRLHTLNMTTLSQQKKAERNARNRL